MPELPEVECVRLSLERLILGRTIQAVRVIRPGVIEGSSDEEALLVGDRVAGVLRHGKQLAILGERGRCVSAHLGMSGQLCVIDGLSDHPPPTQRTPEPMGSLPAHTHVLWELDGGMGLRFTDPRRFGGLWTFGAVADLLTNRWSRLGPDALCISPGQLHRGLSGTSRCLKAALLDQYLIAGLGNIYVDELLFGARLHPLMPADAVDAGQVRGLVRRMRTLLSVAIQRGGSSLRDYVDAANQRGDQQTYHRVYGRSGERCRRRGCPGIILSEQVAGRTTCWCPVCQQWP